MIDEIRTLRSRQSGRTIGLIQFLIEKWDDLDSPWIKSKLQEMVKEDAETDKVIQGMISTMERNESHG